jgi:hypothetical protein
MNENKNYHIIGKLPSGGVYIGISYILFETAVTIIGMVVFAFWFFLVLGTTAFIAADVYFNQIVDYEEDRIKIPITNTKTKNEYLMFIVYFLGVLVAGGVAGLTQYLLTNFKPIIDNLIGIVAISFLVTFLVALQLKSGMSKKKRCENYSHKNDDCCPLVNSSNPSQNSKH